ncbi:MAG: FHA domain-containing protein [Lascolabacillus sp.]|uniref:FHA domain-containing protein n=1 Tax=Lascolabacillus sp. TaxID=1924068 RepID=UPI0025884EF3|nr:DUF805 domain-containing protein [Lascolabacillus sp.]MDD4759155.1 FHA domain-containing protein [Lascolabacillus sp.]
MKTFRIGRNPDNDIVIDDDSLLVSRYHATLKVYDNGTITICDTSRNGTYVNGVKIAKGVETAARREDKILLAGDIPLNWSLVDTYSTAFVGNTEINQYPGSNKETFYKPQEMFSNVFSFEGRIRRLEYGISNIIYAVIAFIINQIVENNYEMNWIYITYIPLMWFLIAQNTKRCHDRGNSGWFQLIPFYGLWLLFAEGEKENNRFGRNPKG